MPKTRLTRCPQCSGSGKVPKPVQARDKDGKTYTEITQVDCPTCDGAGNVIEFDG